MIVLMKSRTEILALLEQNRSRLRQYGVREIGVFGSVIRGEQTSKSDVDVLAEFEKNTFDSYMDLLFYLEELFEADVDLVLKGSIKPLIRENILAETVYVANL